MNINHTQSHTIPPDDRHLLTVPKAARAIGLPVYKLRRGVKLGLIPSHGMIDRRRYVIVAEIPRGHVELDDVRLTWRRGLHRTALARAA